MYIFNIFLKLPGKSIVSRNKKTKLHVDILLLNMYIEQKCLKKFDRRNKDF